MAPSPTIRRLLKETAELSSQSSNPNPAFYAAPVSEADLHEWHFTLLGPPSPSPYAGGMYHGRITLPATYPLKPPNFRFLTPSGRFEVNREICLSISGFHEETWMPAWGVRTALTALRSFMAEKGSAGQVGGLEASADVRKRLARESKGWKCEACGKTNEDVMKEWWEVCREAGVSVQEEEGVELETLPEGMNLEARVREQEARARLQLRSKGLVKRGKRRASRRTRGYNSRVRKYRLHSQPRRQCQRCQGNHCGQKHRHLLNRNRPHAPRPNRNDAQASVRHLSPQSPSYRPRPPKRPKPAPKPS